MSLELDRAQGTRSDKKTSSQRGEEVTKAEALSDAGISTSIANRFEKLAGGREKQGQKAAAFRVSHTT